MSLHQLRLKWAASAERVQLETKVADIVGTFLAKVVDVPEPVAVLAVQAALHAVDEAMAGPVQVAADKVTVVDHRPL